MDINNTGNIAAEKNLQPKPLFWWYPICVWILRLFRAQRWHVQFWTLWCQVTSINQAFPVHEHFQLFSAVLVEISQKTILLRSTVTFWRCAAR